MGKVRVKKHARSVKPAAVLYRQVQYVGFGRYITRWVDKSDMLKYLARWNPLKTKAELRKMLKKHEKKFYYEKQPYKR